MILHFDTTCKKIIKKPLGEEVEDRERKKGGRGKPLNFNENTYIVKGDKTYINWLYQLTYNKPTKSQSPLDTRWQNCQIKQHFLH